MVTLLAGVMAVSMLASTAFAASAEDQAAADNVAALIDAIYVQSRTDETDEQCAAAKEAWDALTDAQKELVEGENADPDYFGRDTGDASLDDARNQDEIGENEILAQAYPVEADIVAGVPESGMTAAAGYAYEAHLPFVHIFHKNSYIGRTFIKPTQAERENAVRMKLNVLDDSVRGKKIVLIDDSIVRGTTIAKLIGMLRNAGALQVHVRICSPPFMHPCYYGTDVPDSDQLIADRMSIEEIRQMIGADSLGYMRIEDLDKTTGGLPTCKACFDGIYPTDVSN